MALLQEDLDQISIMISGAIGQAAQDVPTIHTAKKEEPNVETPDKYLETLLTAKEAIIKRMIDNGPDVVYVRGRRGVTSVNRTLEALNMVDDQIKDWKNRKTHTPVR